MAIPRFPIDPTQSVGRFWDAKGDRSRSSAGVCRVAVGAIEIEVADPITPWMEEVPAAPGVSIRRPATDDYDLVLHGEIPFRPGKITFLEARTVARRSNVIQFGDAGEASPELHRLRAAWCIAGAHVPSSDTPFSAVRARFTHLELWARLNGVVTSVTKAPITEVTLTFAPPEAVVVPFDEFQESATLRLETVGSLPPSSVWGGQVRTQNWLTLEGLSGWTLEQGLSRFVRPVQALLTILAGKRCEVLEYEVRVEDRWCSVYGDPLNTNAPQPADDTLLLQRETLPLETMARWCGVSLELSPGPHVLAAAVAGSFQTIEAEALALTTTAEGLDRALNPGSRRFTEDEVAASVAKLRSSEVPENVRDELISALNLYFAEDSYPTRMLRLASHVAAAAPGCVGRPAKWKGSMRDLRVGLAHALGSADENPEQALFTMVAQVMSLRWTLLVRMLQEAGVPDDTLQRALIASQWYQRDERFWTAKLPKVFASPDAGG